MPLVDAHSKVSQKGYGWHCFGRACHFIHCCLADKQTSHTQERLQTKAERKASHIDANTKEEFSGKKKKHPERAFL